MKTITILFLFAILSGCVTSSKEMEQAARENEERSLAAQERAKRHGEFPGSHDNIEGIERANDDALHFQKEANKDRGAMYEFFSLLLDVVVENYKR
ncbi:hypothetical protein [Umboniibacter marinipuniceus]|uniref:Lipoprotein n=1 Tax=Umboniibacter marinipuniceus TaxID=569599 RepID=A0A3M0A7A8_9GAMM|nr:hypothetical protein [Umboniibacter marinipuniceus]RMA80963.1 hypothetical protein DFR27_0753 [Umboniibacter marinipuniceus]